MENRKEVRPLFAAFAASKMGRKGFSRCISLKQNAMGEVNSLFKVINAFQIEPH